MLNGRFVRHSFAKYGWLLLLSKVTDSAAHDLVSQGDCTVRSNKLHLQSHIVPTLVVMCSRTHLGQQPGHWEAPEGCSPRGRHLWCEHKLWLRRCGGVAAAGDCRSWLVSAKHLLKDRRIRKEIAAINWLIYTSCKKYTGYMFKKKNSQLLKYTAFRNKEVWRGPLLIFFLHWKIPSCLLAAPPWPVNLCLPSLREHQQLLRSPAECPTHLRFSIVSDMKNTEDSSVLREKNNKSKAQAQKLSQLATTGPEGLKSPVCNIWLYNKSNLVFLPIVRFLFMYKTIHGARVLHLVK